MFTYKEVFRKEMNYFSLDELKKLIAGVVPAGTQDEDILMEIEKETYTGYYDDVIVDTYLTISIKEEVQETKKMKKAKLKDLK